MQITLGAFFIFLSSDCILALASTAHNAERVKQRRQSGSGSPVPAYPKSLPLAHAPGYDNGNNSSTWPDDNSGPDQDQPVGDYCSLCLFVFIQGLLGRECIRDAPLIDQFMPCAAVKEATRHRVTASREMIGNIPRPVYWAVSASFVQGM